MSLTVLPGGNVRPLKPAKPLTPGAINMTDAAEGIRFLLKGLQKTTGLRGIDRRKHEAMCNMLETAGDIADMSAEEFTDLEDEANGG